jgi:RNA polymerase sigma-70 factor, ECF subfamily
MKLMLLIFVVLFGRRRSEETDAALLERFRRGDARAIGTLYDRHGRFLVRYTGLYMGDYTVAEDILQEAFSRLMKVCRAEAAQDPDASGSSIKNVRAWMTVTCRHLAIDHVRRQKRFAGPSLDDDPSPANIPRDERNPQADTGDKFFSEALTEALDLLPEEQREVFLMKEVLGFKFREISEQMGVTESTVKSRWRYAMSKLRVALEDWA